ncbi:heat shock protein HslJ [Sulfitobacter undariae]|uniref:Heat shock protein HslJ n=1 Tax=Sulfitobacter undariae TaxID=1563671 RepID=A0A7W6GZ43_9RHOB|nr:META domain-containing protein [Sulfitobacter undariae]MBB3992657.1 heat shock protein HslJ [Sulfitobacter undariae]
MKTVLIPLLIALSLTAACRKDETVSAYGGADHVWTLKTLNGNIFPAPATLTFPEVGQIAGNGPCNSYFGAMDAPYPWFQAGPIGSTRRACPDMRAETVFLDSLKAATLIEVVDDTLILSNPEGLEMIFKATE